MRGVARREGKEHPSLACLKVLGKEGHLPRLYPKDLLTIGSLRRDCPYTPMMHNHITFFHTLLHFSLWTALLEGDDVDERRGEREREREREKIVLLI